MGDLADVGEEALADALSGARAVVHAAGRAHVPSSSDADRARLARDNVQATRRLAAMARRAGVARFVHLSSIKVNGDASVPQRPLRPGDAPSPRDAYARSKLEAEEALTRALRGSSVAMTILRLPMVYGPGARGNFAALVDAVAARRWMPLAAIDNQRRLLSLTNLVDAVRAALDAPTPITGVHFVGDATVVSTPQLVHAVAVALGERPRLGHVPVPLLRLAGAVTRRSAAVDRLTQSLDFDIGSFTSASGWSPGAFALDPAAVGRVPRP